MREDEDEDDYEDEDEEVYHFRKGDLSKKAMAWQAGIKAYDPPKGIHGGTECGCSEEKSCIGERVVHVFFKCPYCDKIVAEHRAKNLMENRMSLWCHGCGCHLWAELMGWKDADWEKAK